MRLYDRYGGAIGDPEELREALEKSDDPELADKSLFVVSANVHH